jgi:hypothetical protein
VKQPIVTELIACILAGVAMLAGCGEDTSAPAEERLPPEEPSEMWSPLSDLEQAYRQRNIERYHAALDPHYYRFYYITTARGARAPRAYWTYERDVRGMERMFDPQMLPTEMRAVVIEFDLIFDKDALVWTEFEPGDPPKETWYTATVPHSFYLKLGSGAEYETPEGARADITVRRSPDDGRWRIVTVEDLGNTLVRITR